MKTSVTPSAISVNHLFPLYLADAMRRGKASWSADDGRFRNHVQSRIGSMALEDVTPDHVVSCLPFHRSPATRLQVIALIRGLFNWARRRRLFKGVNPTDGVDRERFDNRRTTYLGPKEIRRLLDCLDHYKVQIRFRLAIKAILFSGRRRGEILDLEWGDVNFESNLITYRHTKNRRNQTLPVSGPLIEVLHEAAKLEPRKGTRVFPNRDGGRYSGLSFKWIRFRYLHGFDGVRVHDLRHTFASLLASSGMVSLIELKELLGHRDLGMTMRYSHLLPDGLRKTVEKTAGVFGGL
jgi:integrase